ncbi:MAG: hypothetical protein MUP81_00585 [Dehalococcoidia bacterium]|nr:hypothetical protein [Dehalococcoidia bacterium]
MVDDETIEEAIIRLIAVSDLLPAHKASEIIDHLIDSIVADKIGKGEVTIEKLFFDQYLIKPNFESLDGWFQSLVGNQASVVAKINTCRLISGDVAGNITKIYLQSGVRAVDYEKDPWFQAYVSFQFYFVSQDVAFGIGDSNPWGATDFFGFRWQQSDQKLYAYRYKDGVEYKEEIVGFDPAVSNTFKAEMLDSGDTLNFYVNDVLEKTFSSQGITLYTGDYFCIACRSVVAPPGVYHIYISDLIFCQKR